MLLDEKVKTNWNSKTKKHYVDLGYIYTFMKDEFEINVEDLTHQSYVRVNVKCDYCFNDYTVLWCHRIKSLENNLIQNDCCINCQTIKAKEIFLLKYGVENIIDIPGARVKQENTCLEKYGSKNVFGSKEIQEKIIETNYDKYGVKSFTQTKEYIEKTEETHLKKYGVTNHMFLPEYKERFTGKNSPVWKGGIHDIRWDRLQPKYKEWRMEIFKKYNFICQKCKIHPNYLEAHHILNWNDNPDFRYDIDNGIAFCKDCHIDFHRIYGKSENNAEQLIEFLQ